MSDASAYIQDASGERVGYGIWAGSSSVLGPCIMPTTDEAWGYDRHGLPRPDGRNAWDVVYECAHDLEFGYAYTYYGGGFYWPVKFCRQCMVTHGPLSHDGMDDELVPPTGNQKFWPLDGEPTTQVTVVDIATLFLPEKT